MNNRSASNRTHLSTCTGIGGIDLAAEWAGYETVGQVEKKPFCQQLLTQYWPDVPGWSDLHDVTDRSVYGRTGLGPGELGLLSGGFPCQPFSQAGNRRGEDDDRNLWPEMHRLVDDLRPRWFLGENVAGLKSMGKPVEDAEVDHRSVTRTPDRDHYRGVYTQQERMYLTKIGHDLEDAGYSVQFFCLPAVSVDALHVRQRLFIIASRDDLDTPDEDVLSEFDGSVRRDINGFCLNEIKQSRREPVSDAPGDRQPIQQVPVPQREHGRTAADAVGDRRAVSEPGPRALPDATVRGRHGRATAQPGRYHGHQSARGSGGNGYAGRRPTLEEWRLSGGWAVEPAVRRVVDGLPDRVDRIKALGNAVCPQQIYPIIRGISLIEDDLS